MPNSIVVKLCRKESICRNIDGISLLQLSYLYFNMRFAVCHLQFAPNSYHSRQILQKDKKKRYNRAIYIEMLSVKNWN